MTTITAGGIAWEGLSLRGLKSGDILRAGIAFCPQGRCNFPMMTVDENLDMASYSAPRGAGTADRDYVYDLFPILKERRRQPAGYMSGGEQQMLEMGMAMLMKPRLLLIDEPSVGLSPQSIQTGAVEPAGVHHRPGRPGTEADRVLADRAREP